MNVKKLYCMMLCFFCSMAVFSTHAYTCKTVTSTTSVTPPSIVLQRDLPVGSPIGNEIVSSSVNAFTCSNTPLPPLIYQEFGVKAYGNYVTTINGRRVYSTNVAGIGYAVGITSVNNCGVTAYVDGTQNGDGNVNNRLICYGPGLYTSQPVTAQARLQFYKTAQVTGTGTITGGSLGSFILRNDKTSWFLPESYINAASFNVTTVSCSVNNSAITVDMGTVEKRAFSGQGTWPGDANTRNFTVPLTCNAGTKVNIQIDGSAQNTSLGVLNLSGSSSASGVGIQLLYKNAPLSLSSILDAGTSAASGIYTIPLSARYYQTDSNITTGTANASATFTMVYR